MCASLRLLIVEFLQLGSLNPRQEESEKPKKFAVVVQVVIVVEIVVVSVTVVVIWCLGYYFRSLLQEPEQPVEGRHSEASGQERRSLVNGVTNVHMDTYVCTYVYVCIYIYIYICVCVHIHTYIYICIFIYLHR